MTSPRIHLFNHDEMKAVATATAPAKEKGKIHRKKKKEKTESSIAIQKITPNNNQPFSLSRSHIFLV